MEDKTRYTIGHYASHNKSEPITTSEIADWFPIRNNLSLCQEVQILRRGECPKDVCSEYCSMAVELREIITQARAEGARQERERVRAAVKELGALYRRTQSTQADHGKLVAVEQVLDILDAKEADNAGR